MENKKNIHKGHRDRLKAKFERVGLDGFEDHEVLEFLLCYAIPQKDLNPLAHELIDHFGSLNGVFDAEIEDLMDVPGMGKHSSVLLAMVPKLAKRYLDNPAADNRKVLARSSDRAIFFIPKFTGEKEECLYAAFLNSNLEVLSCKKISTGSVDAVKVDNRKILDIALRLRATAVVIAHNHFSHTSPSLSDINATNTLLEKLGACGIRLMDHIIVCGENTLSLSDTGQMRHVL